jgi:histidyl-tRNA synthetase
MKIQNVKGGYDFLPKEQKIRNYINEVLKETFMEYGYGSIETPILCYLDMLVDKYDENNDLLKEIYKLSDQGGRELGLRYDLTVPFAKFIALNKNNISMPFKRYEIAKVFRDGPVKVGRDREFTQCDADVVGIEGQFIEAELLSLYINAFKKLGIDIIIKYNNRNLMRGLIKETGVSEEQISKVITILDKMNKITEAELRTYLIEIAIENEQIDKLLMLFKMDVDKIKDMLKDSTNEELTLGIKEIDTLKGYLEKLGYGEICKVDLTLARGQDYYTGNVFEVYDKSGYLTSSIGGGGRYDKMVTEYINDGEVYPAVGISFGLTSIYEILKTRDDFKNTSDIKFYIIPMGVDMEALSLADTLRSYGYNVDVEMKGRKLKKSLDFANRENIPYVIIVGEDEVKSGKVTVKDMINQNNFEIDLKNPEKVKEIVKL